ncbi:hypothetical protein SKAU_G00155740 [Synaphobranchus kaupii]|uniref:Uncharacterized protein n=1 Tax=Synaphobranchus kaupii TaxID=118154 RepID=A0A9Q1FHV9_SYNKA|nr:hypothetical protein SKAU_G00155740 [Synaphobranchus kaupii]
MIEADVPLEKAPTFASFLKKNCKQGGSIVAASHLHTEYLPELFPQYKQDIKDAVAGKDIYVLVDETTDACGRCVLAILLQPVGKRPVVADQAFLEKINFTTVLPEVLVDLNRVCALVKKVICQAPQCRLQLRSFMMNPVMPIYAVQTRWCSWVRAAEYLTEHLDVLSAFIQTLPDTASCVKELRQLLRDQKAELQAQAMFVVEHSVEVVAALTKLEETAVPAAHQIAGKLEDLVLQFEYGRTAQNEDWRPQTSVLLKEIPEYRRLTCNDLFQAAMTACSSKLQTVLENHPSLCLFRSLTALDPTQVGGARKDIKEHVHAIPTLSQVSAEEWHQYLGMDKADATEVSALDW